MAGASCALHCRFAGADGRAGRGADIGIRAEKGDVATIRAIGESTGRAESVDRE